MYVYLDLNVGHLGDLKKNTTWHARTNTQVTTSRVSMKEDIRYHLPSSKLRQLSTALMRILYNSNLQLLILIYFNFPWTTIRIGNHLYNKTNPAQLEVKEDFLRLFGLLERENIFEYKNNSQFTVFTVYNSLQL